MTKIKKLNQQDREWLYAKAKAYAIQPPQSPINRSTTDFKAEIGDFKITYHCRKEIPDFSFIGTSGIKLITTHTLTIDSLSFPSYRKFTATYRNDQITSIKCNSNRACREVMDLLVRLHILDELASA